MSDGTTSLPVSGGGNEHAVAALTITAATTDADVVTNQEQQQQQQVVSPPSAHSNQHSRTSSYSHQRRESSSGGSGSYRRHHKQHRHHVHHRRRQSNGDWPLNEEDEASSDGSGSESGSTSCSTASSYSVEYPEPRGRSHRHRHHRPSHPQTGAPRRRSQGRHISIQNIPVSRRSTGHRRQVVIDEPEYSGSDGDNNGIDGVEEDSHGRRRSTTQDSSESTEDRILEGDDEDTTVRARQEALNTRHPFGLPIWKPALYKKSRSVTRAAFLALHARPLRSETLYLKPGNIAWMLLAGWWLMLVSMAIAVVLFFVPFGGSSYSRVARGLGWYLFWPFGRYVERIKDNVHSLNRCTLSSVDVTSGASALEAGAGAGAGAGAADQDGDEDAPLLGHLAAGPASNAETRHAQFRRKTALGRAVYYTLLVTLLNPVLILVSALSWFAVFSIPMGKLTHTLSRYLWRDPLSLHFRSGDLPTVQVPQTPAAELPDAAEDGHSDENADDSNRCTTVEQPAPTVLLCTNEAVGWYYYKYTVDGVNILFYNMLSVAAFVLVAAFIIAPLTHHQHFLVQPGVLFPLCLISTVPLAYFIGQAVSSISAQSSLGMGAVINATFGSIVEVILYCIALTQGKARLVEGALIGSLLAGLMLMPGTSMIAGGIKHKVQRFNAKSAEVTATLIIMSIIGAFAPTLFYHTFAVPEFECQDEAATAGDMVRRCKQVHLDIINDPFYLETVKPFMYVCAAILPLAYLIALWFSLKTHVKHIYSSGQTSNPIVRHVLELFRRAVGPESISRAANRTQQQQQQQQQSFESEHAAAPAVTVTRASTVPSAIVTQPTATLEEPTTQGVPATSTTDTLVAPREAGSVPRASNAGATSPVSPVKPPRISRPGSYHHSHSHHHSSAVASGLAYDPANAPSSMPNVPRLSELPRVLAADPDDQLPDLALLEGVAHGVESSEGGGGHDAPNWSKFKSAFILCVCTVMFALIAEVLVDTVDVVIQKLGIKEKYVGLTLFALVPNVTEFMNAIAFAMQNNIALSIEISNAYTVQVALLQIPILVFFSAFYGVPDFVRSTVSAASLGSMRSYVARILAGSPSQVGALTSGGAERHLPTDPGAYVFALIFPRWDLIAIFFCVFLLTYMLIEGRANYFKGSILCLSYFVWMVSYTFEPTRS